MEKSIFDYLNDIFQNKVDHKKYTETDWKKFSPYMINRWISMSPDFIEIINYLQRYTIGVLSNRDVYRLYVDIFPKMKFFSKYTKTDKEQEKYSSNLIDFLCEKFHWNEKECFNNLKMLDTDSVISYLKEYGFSDDDIKKQFKLK